MPYVKITMRIILINLIYGDWRPDNYDIKFIDK